MSENLNWIFEKISKNEGEPLEKIRTEIQKALDLMWKNNDPKAKEYREKIFPNGKPKLEELLGKLAEIAKEKM